MKKKATASRARKPAQLKTTAPTVSVQDVTFTSKSLGRDSKYRIILPPDYNHTTHRYPVLYLLHGVFGGSENWETLTGVSRYAATAGLVIVMPDAGNSWYVNSATSPSDCFEDFLVQDLIPHVEDRWRTLRSTHRRAIAGLSMGGYGALKFAIKNPGLFAIAASISRAFNGPLDLDSRREDLRDDLRKAFGSQNSRTRSDNDLFRLLPAADAKFLPYFYLDCGASDEFCEVNRRLASLLCSRGLRYEYHEVPGEHSWQYWDERIAHLLPLISKKLGAS